MSPVGDAPPGAPPTKTLPVEYRHRVVQLTADGYSTAEVAEALGVSPSWVRSIEAPDRAGEALAPKSRANRRRSPADREGDRVRARVREKPGTAPADRRRDLGLTTSSSNLRNAPPGARPGAQNESVRAAERDRPDAATARAEWAVASAGPGPRRLVFLGETSGTTEMTRLGGWGPTAGRVPGVVPSGHREATT